MAKKYYVYILTNKTNRVLYVGVTNNILKRVLQHKQKIHGGFTKRYNVTKLIHYEETEDVRFAILREKEIKGWLRGNIKVMRFFALSEVRITDNIKIEILRCTQDD
jgi:putative endonuclease